MNKNITEYNNIDDIALAFRDTLDKDNKKYILLFAHNGTGKTRLSMAFKQYAKNHYQQPDTLYFNAYTEDLFIWDNDIEHDRERVLKMNKTSQFFNILQNDDFAIETRIKQHLHRYADFDFKIDYEQAQITFTQDDIDNIKISRGEENIFIWCFFLTIIEIAMDKDIETYSWVKYIYIDDPVSSLDENNIIAIAHHLAQLLMRDDNTLKTIISSHHHLFYNVIYNELRGQKHKAYYLSYIRDDNRYILRNTNDTPSFHHIAILKEIYHAVERNRLSTYHFNILRTILEKSSSFHGFNGFGALIKQSDDDEDGLLRTRMLNILNHGNYSLYEPIEMIEENKIEFKKIITQFMEEYKFNPDLFTINNNEETQS